jgi:hypothetical protein
MLTALGCNALFCLIPVLLTLFLFIGEGEEGGGREGGRDSKQAVGEGVGNRGLRQAIVARVRWN